MVEFKSELTEALMTAKTSTMHIGELAERTGLSLRTIRHYDDVGLLPATSRTEGGFRVYSEADAGRLMLIKQMKPLGFSLEEMAEILAQAEHQRAKMARSLAQADEFIALLGRRTA